MDAKTTKLAREFIRKTGGSWNHAEWLSFFSDAKKAGFLGTEEELGIFLEEQKKTYLKGKAAFAIMSLKERLEEMKNSLAVKKKSLREKEQIPNAAEEGRAEKDEKDVERELLSVKKEIEEDRAGSKRSEQVVGKSKSEFLKTGIEGFDSLLGKGIPRGISILLSGGPGCGKTTFGLHLLAKAAALGERCLYMSFEEKEEQLISHMQNFGFFPKVSIDAGNLIIKRYDPFLISQNVEALLAEARGELLIKLDKIEQFIPKGFAPDIIVIDSLSAVSAAFAGRKDGYRIYIEQLFRSLEKTGATSFLISETSTNLKSYESKVEEFLADGVVAFYNIRKGNSRVKALEIIKIRGVNFKRKIVPFDILEGVGIEVYPMEEVFTRKI